MTTTTTYYTTTSTTWSNVRPGDRIESANYADTYATVTSKPRKVRGSTGILHVYVRSLGVDLRWPVAADGVVVVERPATVAL